MNKKILLLALLMYAFNAQAQFRGGIAAGPVFLLQDNGNDTAFGSSCHGNIQLRLGYHKGRLGLVVTGGMINQNTGRSERRENNIRNTYLTLGPEICFPVGPLTLHLHFSGGISRICGDIIKFTQRNTKAVYQVRPGKSLTGVSKAGIHLNYYFTERTAVSLYADYFCFSARDYRFYRYGSPLSPVITPFKSLVSLSAGITCKF